jgi:hypothetical protein
MSIVDDRTSFRAVLAGLGDRNILLRLFCI